MSSTQSQGSQEEVKLFENTKAADLVTVPGGVHFLSASHPTEVDNAWIEFVGKWTSRR